MPLGDDEDDAGWIVVNTQPHREKLAVENLIRQRFQTYSPQIRKTLRRRTGAIEVLRPLFPSYVFVLAGFDRSIWRPILSTYGVRRVIQFGGSTPYLDPLFIEALRSREVAGAVVKPASPYLPGQDIRIAGGPFDGVVAKILEIGENNRLTILMDLLGQSVRSRIHAHQVSALTA